MHEKGFVRLCGDEMTIEVPKQNFVKSIVCKKECPALPTKGTIGKRMGDGLKHIKK